MRPTLRTALAWAAALLLNVGVLTLIAGLILPRTGSGGATVLVTGVTLCVTGLAAGAAWLLASRAPHP